MKKAAVLPAMGIGDALLMMIASHQLKRAGFQVTTWHDALPGLGSWFPGHDIQPLPPSLTDTLKSCDLILVENDNSPKIRPLIDAHRPRLAIFYPSYLSTKHAPLSQGDHIFDQNLPMVDNITAAIASLLNLPARSSHNGISPPSSLSFRSKKTQVLIHPTSRVPAKNWRAPGFVQVAAALRKRGMHPLFCVAPDESVNWTYVEEEGYSLISPPTLAALAALVYESGVVIGNDSLTGHLASNLSVPTLIIASDERRMRLWRPGWLKGGLVLPSSCLPNWKCLRLRQNHWQHFITAAQVLRGFDKLVGTL